MALASSSSAWSKKTSREEPLTPLQSSSDSPLISPLSTGASSPPIGKGCKEQIHVGIDHPQEQVLRGVHLPAGFFGQGLYHGPVALCLPVERLDRAVEHHVRGELYVLLLDCDCVVRQSLVGVNGRLRQLLARLIDIVDVRQFGLSPFASSLMLCDRGGPAPR